jgi:TatD DNase family protein
MEIDKPIVVHSRKAELKCIEILEQMNAKKVLMHCFSGKISLVGRIINSGWFISIPASIKYNSQFQLIAEKVPMGQLFCETDAPFLHPDKERDNEPALVLEAYKKIAEINHVSLEEIEEKIEKNYHRFFGK